MNPTSSFLLTVNHFNKVIPQYQRAEEGQTVLYYCTSWTEVKWTYDNKSLPSNAITFKYPGSTQNVLQIRNIQLNNSGSYTCTSYWYNCTTLANDGELEVVG